MSESEYTTECPACHGRGGFGVLYPFPCLQCDGRGIVGVHSLRRKPATAPSSQDLLRLSDLLAKKDAELAEKDGHIRMLWDALVKLTSLYEDEHEVYSDFTRPQWLRDALRVASHADDYDPKNLVQGRCEHIFAALPCVAGVELCSLCDKTRITPKKGNK